MGRRDLTAVFKETLQILERGSYEVNGRNARLHLDPDRMRACRVFLPEDLEALAPESERESMEQTGTCAFSCVNADSFAHAGDLAERYRMDLAGEGKKPVLVLNLANPVNPGGGVLHGARAQEEDLCRKSSLFLSLVSRAAAPYYEYNRRLDSWLGSDAMILTPQAEVIRGSDNSLLEEPFLVSVLTCAAPVRSRGLYGLTPVEYEDLIYHRICLILKAAACLGYEYLVLGAFGCGAFGNDAARVSALFEKAFREFTLEGRDICAFFKRADFAVLDRTDRQYNYRKFAERFGAGREGQDL